MSEVRWPVSVKGVVRSGRDVLLLLNERNEWELPGGRLEARESPEACVEREILEETGLAVRAVGVVDSWVYSVLADRDVLIVTYRCSTPGGTPTLTVSEEHGDARWFDVGDLSDLPLPDGYRRSILACGSVDP